MELNNIKKEQLLVIARREYPVGSKIKCVKDGEEGISISEIKFDVSGHLYTEFKNKRVNQYVYIDSASNGEQWSKNKYPEFYNIRIKYNYLLKLFKKLNIK